MALGDELKTAVFEMLTADDNFGSQLTIRYNSRVQDVVTGNVTVNSTTEVVRGAVSDALGVEPFFKESTLNATSSAVVLHVDSLSQAPALHDEVAITDGEFLRIMDVAEFRGPGDANRAVTIAYVIALGA